MVHGVVCQVDSLDFFKTSVNLSNGRRSGVGEHTVNRYTIYTAIIYRHSVLLDERILIYMNTYVYYITVDPTQ